MADELKKIKVVVVGDGGRGKVSTSCARWLSAPLARRWRVMLPCVRVCLFTDMPVDQLHRGPLSRGLRTSARLL